MRPRTHTTERLLLCPLSPDDTEEVYEAAQDPDILRWLPLPSPYEPRHAEEFLRKVVPDGWREDTTYTFGVRPRDGGPLLATVSLHHPDSGTWEIGFWTTREHRGRGYATEAVLALAHWAFTDLRCGRLEWRAEVGNTGSRIVAEKAGFQVEGVLRSGMLNKGVRRDCWIGSLLPADLGLPGVDAYLPSPG
ncbi:GNAT family N-acetyltransferase [Streptomyces apocyni]|uniref:GNAT family N-acetyltransferase n=1 Tax=Streptomyces apocyni TaxID=2654677 RepID=UPI0012EA680E|nr:GNAT family N-acetyltransferase [Streptomyces apocyni]